MAGESAPTNDLEPNYDFTHFHMRVTKKMPNVIFNLGEYGNYRWKKTRHSESDFGFVTECPLCQYADNAGWHLKMKVKSS